MRTVTSADGTTIAFEQSGSGPTLVLVGGMFEQRAVDSETARLAAFAPLAEHFSVIHYDRRGRGDSGDTQPFSVQREVEDIAAIIDATGGSAFLSGISSGAALAFEAALALDGRVGGLAMCERRTPSTRRDARRGAPSGRRLTLHSQKVAMAMPSERSCFSWACPQTSSTGCARTRCGRNGKPSPRRSRTTQRCSVMTVPFRPSELLGSRCRR